LHEVAAGAAKRSWGVHVAELAGVPAPVVRRSAQLLALMEKHGGPLGAGAPLGALPLFAGGTAEEPLPAADELDPLHAAMTELDPDRLSPREALEALYRLKALLPVSATAGT
jgi:DNA mismatch repair protein MutS